MIQPQALIEKFKYALAENWGYIWGTAGEKWTAAKQADLEKTTDKDREQGRKYGSKWIGHIVTDCSGLFSWAFKKLGGYMYHGSNTMYLKYCAEKGQLKAGKRTDGQELKAGTAVFKWNGSTYSHVGLYIGNGEVIEAASTTQGVIKGKATDSKWTHWGELTGVNYSGKEPEPEKDEAVVTGKNVALRTGPGTQYKIIERIPTGRTVKVLDNGWTYVEHGGNKGFMMDEYIRKGEDNAK